MQILFKPVNQETDSVESQPLAFMVEIEVCVMDTRIVDLL